MNIYLISQDYNNGRDTYDSAVVVAKSGEDAKTIHPGGGSVSNDDLKYGTWASENRIEVKEIGVIFEGQERGVICASFNAG